MISNQKLGEQTIRQKAGLLIQRKKRKQRMVLAMLINMVKKLDGVANIKNPMKNL